MGGWDRDGEYSLANAGDRVDSRGFYTHGWGWRSNPGGGYGVSGDDNYVDFIFEFDDANTWCGGYRQFGDARYWGADDGAPFTKDIEIYTWTKVANKWTNFPSILEWRPSSDANFGWKKVATDSHSTWHNNNRNTFTNDGTTTEWTPTAPSKYLKVRTLTNHGFTKQGGLLTVRFLQLKFAVAN